VARLCQRRGSGIARAPSENLTGDVYFTDGLRAVAAVSSRRIPAIEVKYISWEPPSQPMRNLIHEAMERVMEGRNQERPDHQIVACDITRAGCSAPDNPCWQAIAFVADSSKRPRSKIRGAWASAGPCCLLPRSCAHPTLSLGKCQNGGPSRLVSVFLGPLGNGLHANSDVPLSGGLCRGLYCLLEENCSSSRSTERRGVSVPYNPGANHLSAAAIILTF
jgi:hypothetical protein